MGNAEMFSMYPDWKLQRRRRIDGKWSLWEDVDVDYALDTLNPTVVNSVFNILRGAIAVAVSIHYPNDVISQFRRVQRSVTER